MEEKAKSAAFCMKLAEICVGVEHSTPEAKRYCAGYCADLPCKFTVAVTQEDIDAEADALAKSRGEIVSERLPHELSAIQRKIAEEFPKYGRFLMHGAAITYQDDAYLFCAPSGVGKSTHISLWKRHLGGEVDIINGDKPFLSLDGDTDTQHFRVHGSPWAGKERWQKNRNAPLRAICFLARGNENSIVRLQPSACLPQLMRQVYIPRDPQAAGRTLELIDRLTQLVPLYQLRCNISEDAVRSSFETLVGRPYPQ